MKTSPVPAQERPRPIRRELVLRLKQQSADAIDIGLQAKE
jgi:hypothetical protein